MIVSTGLKVALTGLVLSMSWVVRAEAGAETEAINTVRNRFVSDLLTHLPEARTVHALLQTLSEDGSWPDIDYRDVSNTSWDHHRHWDNMVTLSVAYRHPDSTFRGNPSVRSAVLSALDFWLAHDFKGQNWYHNVIATPSAMADVLLLMHDALTDAQRKKAYGIAARATLQSRWARPGADRSRIAGIVAKMALVSSDPEAFRQAMDVMVKAVHVTSQRGLQADMSYQHRSDRVTSTLTYGASYVHASATMAKKVADTPFEFPASKRRLLIDFYLDGIAKSMAHGRFIDPQQANRGISRRRAHAAGVAVPQMLADLSSYRRGELNALIAVRRGKQAPAYRFNKYFWRSAYHTHQRPGYFTSVRLYSTRNRSMERAYNEEGLRNHYLADGANFLIRTGKEYLNMFPIYDWRKIPGTTVVQKEAMPHPNAMQQAGRTEFVGGVSDGMVGATAFDFDSPLDDLKARKAWFFFDREYVCLGAGIRSGEAHPVATTLNQALLNGEVAVMDGKGLRTLPRGRHKLKHARAVWHDQVAYVFPAAKDVRLETDTVKGSWWSITRHAWARNTAVEKDRFLLWIDHGPAPEHADYAYIVVPGLARDKVRDYVTQTGIRIVNTPERQAVMHVTSGVVHAVFYDKGTLRIPGGSTVAMQQPGLLTCHVQGGKVSRMAVADPTARRSTLRLSLNQPLKSNGETWSATWNAKGKQSELSVTLPRGNRAGQPIVMDF